MHQQGKTGSKNEGFLIYGVVLSSVDKECNTIENSHGQDNSFSGICKDM